MQKCNVGGVAHHYDRSGAEGQCDQIVAMLVAANLDAAADMLSEKLDLERRPNRHIAFGTGIHCASVTNSRAWKANTRSRLCTRAGLNFGRFEPGKSDGAVDPE